MAMYLYMHIHNITCITLAHNFSSVMFSSVYFTQNNGIVHEVHEQDYCINNYADHTNSVT